MGDTTRPVIRAALVLSVAWLFFWPYQFPWYDTMIIVLLMFYPATRIDWLVIARVAVGSLPNTPGNPTNPPGHVLDLLHHWSIVAIAPLVLLAAALGLIVLCVTRQWTPRVPGGPPGPAPEEPELVPSAANLSEAPPAARLIRGTAGRQLIRRSAPASPAAAKAQPAQSAGVGARSGPGPIACSTISVTTGLVGSWPWLIRSSGQTDWIGTSIAPASRADSGGVTTLSSVVHSDIQRGREGAGAASSWASRLLPGTSCWHAAGHAPGTNPSAPAAIFAPWYGEPSVITRRALAAPSSWRAHSSATTPPAE